MMDAKLIDRPILRSALWTIPKLWLSNSGKYGNSGLKEEARISDE